MEVLPFSDKAVSPSEDDCRGCDSSASEANDFSSKALLSSAGSCATVFLVDIVSGTLEKGIQQGRKRTRGE